MHIMSWQLRPVDWVKVGTTVNPNLQYLSVFGTLWRHFVVTPICAGNLQSCNPFVCLYSYCFPGPGYRWGSGATFTHSALFTLLSTMTSCRGCFALWQRTVRKCITQSLLPLCCWHAEHVCRVVYECRTHTWVHASYLNCYSSTYRPTIETIGRSI